MNKIKVIIMLLVFLVASTAHGAAYYVNGVSGDDDNPGTIEKPWKTIYKANITLKAGDTVYIRGGKIDYQIYEIGAYDGSMETRGIQPSNTGTCGNPITYSVYPGEKVHLRGNDDSAYTRGVYLNNKSYIKVTGVSGRNLKFSKMWKQLYIENDSHYNEIAYCEFTEDGKFTWGASQIKNNVTYNHIHDCTFSKHGYLGPNGSENEGGLFDVGRESYEDIQLYNVIENCEFYHSGHHVFGLYGQRTIVRNNYFHNEEWYEYEGVFYSYRNIMVSGKNGYSGYNLFEGNRIGYAGENVTTSNQGGGGMKLTTSGNILRYNSWFGNKGMALYIQPAYGNISSYNYIYNNTFFYNGYYSTSAIRDVIKFGCQVDKECWAECYQNVIKNNLFYQNYTSVNGDERFFDTLYGCTDEHIFGDEWGDTTIENNWDDYVTKSDPLFVNVDTFNKRSWHLPNLNLQLGSPCIDQGIHLTQANGSGANSTKLIVSDSKHFQDGNFGQDPLQWPSSVNIQADWIAIGTVSNVVQISSIDYHTNTITLASPMTWGNGDRVWLYKKSDGMIVLKGVAPNIGAHEYYTPVSPPQNMRADD